MMQVCRRNSDVTKNISCCVVPMLFSYLFTSGGSDMFITSPSINSKELFSRNLKYYLLFYLWLEFFRVH